MALTIPLTEGRGTGIPLMQRFMRRNGSPEPILETDEDANYFLTKMLVHLEFEDLLKAKSSFNLNVLPISSMGSTPYF